MADSSTGGSIERTATRTATRRRALASIGTTLLVAAAGCSGLTGSPSGGSGDTASPTGENRGAASPTGSGSLSGEWETTTEGDAKAAVVSSGLSGAKLQFRVFRCADAYADAVLGTVEDTIAIRFEYTTRAEDWWEVPYLQVREDDSVVYSVRDDDETKIEHAQAAERSGSAETTVEVDGETAVRFGITPSRKCENANHQNTYFTVDELTIERA